MKSARYKYVPLSNPSPSPCPHGGKAPFLYLGIEDKNAQIAATALPWLLGGEGARSQSFYPVSPSLLLLVCLWFSLFPSSTCPRRRRLCCPRYYAPRWEGEREKKKRRELSLVVRRRWRWWYPPNLGRERHILLLLLSFVRKVKSGEGGGKIRKSWRRRRRRQCRRSRFCRGFCSLDCEKRGGGARWTRKYGMGRRKGDM